MVRCARLDRGNGVFPVTSRLNDKMVKVLAEPELRTLLVQQGFVVAFHIEHGVPVRNSQPCFGGAATANCHYGRGGPLMTSQSQPAPSSSIECAQRTKQDGRAKQPSASGLFWL
jgi:hypothetical protein